MKANIGIPEKQLATTALLLNKLLADEYVLYTKTKFYHWNVEGENFHPLHVFFDEQADQLEDFIDDVAERVRALGHYAVGSLKSFLDLTNLLETNDSVGNSKKMIQDLLHDHETIIRQLRQNVDHTANELKDVGTSDFLTGLMEQHEKMAWMLRSFLK